MDLEIGSVYRRKGRVYLAVDLNLLISYVNGKCEEVRPSPSRVFRIDRSLSINLLLVAWEITLDELDRTTYLYLRPAAHRNVGVRQRRSKRRGSNDEELEIFRALRLQRVFIQHKSI